MKSESEQDQNMLDAKQICETQKSLKDAEITSVFGYRSNADRANEQNTRSGKHQIQGFVGSKVNIGQANRKSIVRKRNSSFPVSARNSLYGNGMIDLVVITLDALKSSPTESTLQILLSGYNVYMKDEVKNKMESKR